ncbi:NAD(P)-dependent oxidoreductase [bacterium]|jgi:CDP-paratose synthetase|nr:NAD(P)-dependent oxidoreductase [bacterium]
MKILLTGGTGFLGSNILRRLLGLGHELFCIKRETSSLERVKIFKHKIKWFNVETSDFDEIISSYKIEGIIHCATDYGRKQFNPIQTIETNLILPLKLLHAAANNNVLVFINTDTVLDKRVDTYSLSKRQFSEWLEKYSNDILTINVALEHFYGPFDNDSKFVTYVIRKMLGNEDSIDFTLGLQKRNFVYIEDVIDAFIVLLNNINKLDNSFHNFEVGTEDSVSIKDFVGLVKKLCNNNTTDLNFGAINYRENEVMNTNTNTDKLKSLGWFPRFSLEDGLKNTIDLEKKLKIE